MHITKSLTCKRGLEIFAPLFRPLCSNVNTDVSKGGGTKFPGLEPNATPPGCKEPKWSLLYLKLERLDSLSIGIYPNYQLVG